MVVLSIFSGIFYFFRNVNKMAAWIPDNKKKTKKTMFIVNNRQLLLDMK
jgi:hypothetical protein